ncbi:hypothetical protein [Acinetobacter sp. AG3]|uniref:hypothetical protein n=1 Tax=Acinetobacter TaxID=469 RepID=UPI001EF15BDA|nr:hypothetical protein [Acinetobacter sp. AG3]MCG7221984.1 hypothetical protein [Acinetobacter sp. AG3]
MSGDKNCKRMLVVKRHPKFKHKLTLCDEETGQPLSGLIDIKIESSADAPAKLIATFEAWGSTGIRFEDDFRQTF